MPQLSLYLDKPTLKLVNQVATQSNTSMSKWVRQAVMESLNNEWPKGYFDICGSITDTSFDVPEEAEVMNSTFREEL